MNEKAPPPSAEEIGIALEESIEHWHRFATGTASAQETVYGDSCALCKLFVKYPGRTCAGCPVNETGFKKCGYNENGVASEWIRAESRYRYRDGPRETEFMAAAALQRDFLKSLRKFEPEPKEPEQPKERVFQFED